MATKGWLVNHLAWKVENGLQIRLGLAPWVRSTDSFILSQDLRSILGANGCMKLGDCGLVDDHEGGFQNWISVEVLELEGELMLEWNIFVRYLRKEGIRLTKEEDVLTWSWKKDVCKPKTNMLYDAIFETQFNVQGEWWNNFLWSNNLPMKIVLFGWLVLKNKVLTWEKLRKRGWFGPGRCGLCRENEEIVNHLFISCPFVQSVWSVVMQTWKFNRAWKEEPVDQSLFLWFCDVHSNSFKDIPFLLWWGIWNQRNELIFSRERCKHFSDWRQSVQNVERIRRFS